MGLFWRRKKDEFISLGLSAPDEPIEPVEVDEAVEQSAQWRAESAPVVAEPEVVEPVAAEPVAAEPETVKPVEITAEQWAIEAAKLFEPAVPTTQGPQSTATKPAMEERVEEPVEEENFFSRFRKAVSATRENIATRIEDAVKGKK